MTSVNRFEAGELDNDALVREFLAAAIEVHHRGINVVESLDALATPEVELDPHAQTQITEARHTLAQQFSTSDRILTPDDFEPILINQSKGQSLYVALTAEKGLRRGSFDQIMSAENASSDDYIVEVNGQLIDTRAAMTRRLHRAIVLRRATQQAQQPPQPAGIALPEHPKPRVATWYTGDRPEAQLAPFGYDDDLFPQRLWRGRTAILGSTLFRPGVKIDT